MSRKRERKITRTEYITISYDANDPKLKEHKLSAKELGQAIIAMQELIEKSDRLLNPGRRKSVGVFVKTPAQAGSLEVVFGIDYYNMASQVIDVLPYLGIGYGTAKVTDSLFKAIEETQGKTVIAVHTEDNSDNITLHIDGQEITKDKNVAKLLGNKEIRENVQQLLSPVLEKANPTFRIFEGDGEKPEGEETRKQLTVLNAPQIETVKKMEMDSSQEPEPPFDTTISLTTVSFKGKKGWEMNYQNKNIPVEIIDEAFIAKINEDIASFQKGDLFTVTMQKTVNQFGEQAKESYTIIKVKHHLARSERRLVSENGESK
ncbi:hypothetical protein Q7526_00390 [Glaesserella parasuis]|uniref:hypothetical protein n=1 Tax=Glaesserella parasuis TaxID=738 RepID=UPI0003ABE15C|nr:hypothetical protein [Glaesserella parasuis]ATW43330.1 hypothetical protein A2U20_05740 [Glaesserella parasuis D74]EQA10796.1 hypothetical protein HPSD74_0496 [Glaesserella parasuis D74]MDO9795694.1 hypothetical protein [Glaesserella parasuis]MDO9960578.1 hypothetical protein [Glaesserella parasuis]MDP0316676.1 hypothetical protein [Glaesserella parasuis]